ncbi:hypothetical protein BDP27DRAFT_1401039 [Rhodocollybia butyracea]|uniref:F-box domain-containing protein n=1 Tax=Rhodocollybia butyracea TaxID=206335 RepID=A0A9P5PZF4_9AGAR|nr:hypothetical protein BDP27DRAFT_1401039 [Rhodocollybia butyracea]
MHMVEGSPVDRAPNEVLAEIFDYMCDTNLLQEYPWHEDSKLPPPTPIVRPLDYLPAMTISCVCKQWRSVALSLPAIWSRITLELSLQNPRQSNVASVLSGFLQTVQLHLHRSGQRHLTLKLRTCGADDVALLAFDLACDHTWCSFELVGGPCLRKGLDMFYQAKELRSLSLDSISYAPTTFSKTSSLTALTLDPMSGKVDSVFNHASSPHELVLRQSSSPRRYMLAPCEPPRLCTSVSTLKLELHGVGNDWDLLADVAFSSFNFPSLRYLVIMTDGNLPYQGPWPTVTLGAFLHRSSCSLTKFDVMRISVTDIDLIDALKLMPSLVNLHIDDTPAGNNPTSPITPQFLRSLHRFFWIELNLSSSALVPKLRELRLTFDGVEFDDSEFIDMVTSRWIPDTEYASSIGFTCLRVATLRFNTRVVDQAQSVYRPLHRLDEAGMMVVVLGKGDF